jgi:maltose phosphorylase
LYSVLYGYKRPTSVATLLTYRYNQLDKAIENGKLDLIMELFHPSITMNGEECHNEWEITLKKFIAAISLLHNYHRYRVITAIFLKRLEVLIGIVRFASKSNFSAHKTNM